MSQDDGTPAVVAARTDDPPADTTEIRALARSAGYEVRGEVTQARPEDPGTHLGAGKLAELADLTDRTGARTVVVDGELAPAQHCRLREAMPDDARVSDRYRLVLEIFGDRAGSRRAQLQIELARLQYDLPRVREAADEGMLNRRVEKGSPVYDLRDRIDRLEGKLADLPDPAEEFRERRRAEGFDLVTVAGYTNAGKSTLLHRLADDLDCESTAPDHPDRDATAAVEDRLFETLETTTRRATVDGRPVLCTDTVGFVSELPHRLVESFSETLSEAAAADVVVLVADAADPVEELREKLRVSMDVLGTQGVPEAAVVTALNKVDRLDDDERDRRLDAAAGVAPSPVCVSVRDGTNVDRLLARVSDRLPTERADLRLPNCRDAMAVVSRAHDRTTVDAVEYGPESIRLSVRGRPAVVDGLRSRADGLRSEYPT